MAHPNNLDRCRMKHLMRNIVSGRTWVVGTCVIPALGDASEGLAKIDAKKETWG